jgi:hypothetical protein
MRARRRPLLALLLASGLCAPPGGAHTRVRAVVATDPAPPVAGRPCEIRVTFVTPDGTPAALVGWQVRLRGEMRAHPMPPVEATFDADSGARVWQTSVRFSMAGAWDVTITAARGHDRVAGTTRLLVVANQAAVPPDTAGSPPQTSGRATGLAASVALETPDAALPWSPWTVLLGAVGFTALLETLAIVRAWRVRRGTWKPGRARRRPPREAGRRA